MATECRRTKSKRINRNKLMKVYAYGILLLLIVIGGVMGLPIGRATAPVNTEIVTETVTVEVPVYEADKLPELGEVFYYDIPLSDSLQRYIYEVCADEGVPVTLVLAMIEHESRFNPEVVSSTDDYGLMQINEVNARIKDLETEVKEITDLTISINNLALSVDAMAKEQKKQGEQLESLKAKDGERWRSVTGYVITAIIGIIVGFIFKQMGF